MEWEGLLPQFWRMQPVVRVTVVNKRYFEPHAFVLVENETTSVRVHCKFIF